MGLVSSFAVVFELTAVLWRNGGLAEAMRGLRFGYFTGCDYYDWSIVKSMTFGACAFWAVWTTRR